MAKRRGNNEGALARRANGTREGKVSVVDPQTGQRKRVSVYGATAPIVRAKMKELRTRVEVGAPIKDATSAVADWLIRWRTTTLAVSDRKESTRSLYASLSRKHLETPRFGAIGLDKLRPSDIEALLLALRGRGLSESTVRQAFIVLRLALEGACRDQLIAVNPAARVTAPGVTRREAVHLAADDVVALLTACQESRHHDAIVLAASTGLRKGEVLALPWSAVDLDAGTLRVTATVGRIDGRLVVSAPKTAHSRRVVPLDSAVVAMLRRHRTEQKAQRLAASEWTDTDLVFTSETGELVDPRSVLRVVQDAAKRLGLAGVCLHTLRHSAAASWLENGVHIKAVSDLLGHSSVAITGDVYGHMSDDTARAAVTGLAGRLGLSQPKLS
jgi:integrase